MSFSELLQSGTVLLDGGMGTLLCEKGLKPGEPTQRWNLTHPEEVAAVHRAYMDAGSNIVCANTFGVNTLNGSLEEADALIGAAFDCLRRAKAETAGAQEILFALDMGPLGRLLEPFGYLSFEDAVSAFADVVRLGVKHGAQAIVIETFTDLYETKAALLAAKENSDLPVIVSNAYSEDGRLLTGARPEAVIAALEGMGADVIGVNCSFGPKALLPIVETYLARASVPVIFQPNAGLPETTPEGVRYNVGPEEFAADVTAAVKKGVRLAGGCCGTTPDYIRALREAARPVTPAPLTEKPFTVVTSRTHAVELGEKPVIIGERINPTGKKKLRQAILDEDWDYLLGEAEAQQEAGAQILDVNVGVPGTDETANLRDVTGELQAEYDLPLQIDTADPAAMEAALRRYNGKAMINSVNGKRESMEAVFPLVKKYGGVVVALTLDENGIPETAAGRVAIAESILKEAAKHGVKKKDIVFDPLCLTVSADPNAAATTLAAVREITQRLGCHTVLGVSNVSFGLPDRPVLNGAFLTLALENGLSAAIMNPCSDDMMRSYRAFNALRGHDTACADYIAYCQQNETQAPDVKKEPAQTTLRAAVEKGQRDKAGALARELLLTVPPMAIVTGEIMPALEAVGKDFESGRVFLPGLLMSAEAAKSAFEAVKAALQTDGAPTEKKAPFVLATVKGDVHDIGKNIVKLLLENYGCDVIDLGKDVPPETVADAVVAAHAPLCGLSALMTTTVPAMEQTILLLREKAPWCKIVVGGAVLTESYAARIGADRYASDAMAAVRYAEEVLRFES
ncbi:MAG: homocysteine S-methyltransferase family protein [Clostridia bacterium]|nr:homocysteine S-methyltransferase family protein [Clostridia bacterium]